MEALIYAGAAVFAAATVFLFGLAAVTARRFNVATADAAAAASMIAARSKQDDGEGKEKQARAKSRSQEKLDQAGMSISSPAWGLMRAMAALAGACIAWSVFMNPLLAAAAAVMAFCALGSYRKRKVAARQDELSLQLAGALPQVAANIRCGMTAERALKITTDVAEEPMRSQFERLNAQLAYGVRLDEGLADMAERNGNADIKLVSIAVGMQQDAGGNLADVLERIAGKIQARMSLRRHVRSATASVRSSRNILLLMPWFIALVVGYSMAGGMSFWNGAVGIVLAAAILALETAGWVVMGKIINIKID